MPRAQYPFDRGFYEELIAARDQFRVVRSHRTDMTGYGFRVRAGEAYRLTLLERAQILDMCVSNADDPREHFFTGATVAIEGGKITRFTRLWGTPPLSRPLVTCIADTVRVRESADQLRDHFAYGAHCNPHLWHLYAGVHHRPCYDNLRFAYAMLGLSQRAIHDNVNLFQKGAYNPYTGAHMIAESDARRTDYIEFYAEIDVIVAISLCPSGAGSDAMRESWSTAGPTTPVHPILVEVFETDRSPRPWPPAHSLSAGESSASPPG
jgi:uncharacterized protein YcgI (DUF1989 family)